MNPLSTATQFRGMAATPMPQKTAGMRYSVGRPDGFTLLEMLVATAMVAVLAGSLYASLHIAFKAQRSAMAAMETVRKNSLAMEIIQADLLSATIPSGTLAGPFLGQPIAAAPGSAGDSLAFYSAASDIVPAPGVGDIKKIEYACEASAASGEVQLLRLTTTNLLAPETPDPKEEVLARGVRTFTLRYFDGQAWQDAWDSTTLNNILPKAVEVTIAFNDASGNALPPICRVVLIPCAQGQSQDGEAAATSGGTP